MQRRVIQVNTLLFSTTTLLLVALMLITVGCNPSPPAPTAASIQLAQTQEFLTRNAPPTGFEGGVSFPKIDANLVQQAHWHYAVSLTFDGVIASSQKKASGVISADVYSNEGSGERRVLLQTAGDAFGTKTARYLEGVRIGNDYYRVDQSKACTVVTGDESGRKLAELSAGSLVGGIKVASYTPNKRQSEVLTDTSIWEYAFSPDDVIPPTVELSPGGTITIASGGLWIAPSINAVAEYQITLNVVNGKVQGSEPLTGQLRVNYKLLELAVPYNISIPYGC